MSLPVFLDSDPRTKKVHSHYLKLLFEKMGPDLLESGAPGDRQGMYYPMHLGSPYRLGPDSSESKAGEIFIYDFLQIDAWKKIEERGGYLLIDHIVESFFGRRDMVERFHQGMELAGLNPERVVLLNGNLLSKSRYDLLADQLGITDRAHVIPYNGCFWLINAHNQATGSNLALVATRAERARSLLGRERLKKFVTFNGKGRPHRTYVILRMIADGHREDGFISLLGHETNESPSEIQVASQIGRFPDAERLLPHIPSFIENLPLTIDISRASSRDGSKFKLVLPWASPDPDIYDQTYFSVVLDTSFTDLGTLFHTPIAYKSFMNFSPFIYFGNAGGLRALRDMGFQSFSPFINEEYDTIVDDNERMASAYREFERLVSLDHKELNDGLSSLWSVLEHNYTLIHRADVPAFANDWNKLVSDNLPGAARLAPVN